jgi:acyl-CoA synthetase (AMP-forming)/AMP-acid ligase II
MGPSMNRKPLPVLTDERARETPERVYSIVPKTTALEDGFVNFTYQQLARAINKTSWWLDQHLGKSVDFETFAYIGLNDHRYTILCLAAVKNKTPGKRSSHKPSVFKNLICLRYFSLFRQIPARLS